MEPSRPPSLKRGFAWTFVGNLVYAASQWGILSLITKFATDEASGQFGLGMTITAPLFMFAGLDLRILLATDSRGSFRFAEYFTLRITGSALAVAVVMGILLWRGDSLATQAIVLAVCLGKVVEFLSDMCYGRLQVAERLDCVSRSTMLHGAVSFVAFGAILLPTGSVLAAAVASGLGRLLVLLAHDGRITKRNAPQMTLMTDGNVATKLSFPRLFRLTKSGLPLATKTLLVSLNTQTARLFVERMIGMSALGVFYPISHVGFAGLTFSRALNQSVASRLGRFAQNGMTVEFRSLLRKLLLMYAVLGLFCVGTTVLAGPLILRVFFNTAVAAHAPVLVLIMGSMALQLVGGILELAMTALRKLTAPAWLSAASLVILGVCCRWLIPELGLGGAALAMILSRLPRPLILGWIVFRSDCLPAPGKSDEEETGRKAA